MIDYHIHTKASPDAEGSMQDYVKSALKKKIREIGFSDHILMKNLGKYRSDLLHHQMPAYIQHFLDLKEKSEVSIKLGIEVDFFPDKLEETRDLVRKYAFDYVIGSVHVIDNWIIDDPDAIEEYTRRDLSKVYTDYFDLVKESCACRLFDVLGHPDIIKIFGFRPQKDMGQIYEETAKAISAANMCAEINTKGLIRPCHEVYPSLEFLKELHAVGVPIILGSDAHSPRELGRNLDEAVKLAKKAGYTEACTFSQRKRGFTTI